jgi:hypothetical protein
VTAAWLETPQNVVGTDLAQVGTGLLVPISANRVPISFSVIAQLN